MSDSLCNWESKLSKAEELKKRWEKILKVQRRTGSTKNINFIIKEIEEVNGIIRTAKREIKAIKKEQKKK